MFRPTVGELLAGIADGLRDSVLPTVTDGHAKRQLRAALHSLGRIQKSWDLWPGYLADDNADMRQTLSQILAEISTGIMPLPEPIALIASRLNGVASDDSAQLPHVNDRTLAMSGLMNGELQTLVIATDEWLSSPNQVDLPICRAQKQALSQLYSRMIERELQAWATQVEED